MKHFVAMLLALASLNTYAGLTKWVDSQGVVHYTDGPAPANVKSESIRTTSPTTAPAAQAASAPNAASAPADTGPKNIFERAAEMKKEQKEKEEAAKKEAEKKAQADAKLKNCESARAQVQSLQNSPRVMVYDEKGEPKYMDDSTRQQKITEAQDAVSKNCN